MDEGNCGGTWSGTRFRYREVCKPVLLFFFWLWGLILGYCSDSGNEGGSSSKRKKVDGERAAMKAELRRMTSKPLVARGISIRYITSGSRPIVDDLLAGESKLFRVF